MNNNILRNILEYDLRNNYLVKVNGKKQWMVFNEKGRRIGVYKNLSNAKKKINY